MFLLHFIVMMLQDTLGAPPATEVKLEDHCPYKYGHMHNLRLAVFFSYSLS